MSTPERRIWLAVALFVTGLPFRGMVAPLPWLVLTVVVVLDTLKPAWYRPPAWLQRPALGVIGTAVYGLTVLPLGFSFGSLLWTAAAGVFAWDAHLRGDLRAAPGMLRSLRDATPPPAGAGGDVERHASASVRRQAIAGAALCFASLFLTWAPYQASGFVSFERRGTLYVDDAGRTVDDNTYSAPVWNDRSRSAETGLQLGQGGFAFLVAAGALAVCATRFYERRRIRHAAFYAGTPLLGLCTYANGYAADGVGWWVFVAGLAVYALAVWRYHTLRAVPSPAVAGD